MAINKNKVMDAGRKAYEKGQYDKAIREYLKIVKEDPKDVRVWLKVGDLYAKKGAKAEATDTYMKVARFYSEQGFYRKAVAVYQQILKVDPRLVEVNLKLAELYRQLGLLSEAVQHFERVAAFFHREGKTQEALATLRQLVDLDPENVATRIKLAELYSKESMTAEAIKEFGITCDFLRKSGRQDDFIKVAERLIFHDPDNVELCRELAALYLSRNDPRRALAKLQICFKADQDDPQVLALLAQAFQRLDQKGKTVSVLKELARVHAANGKRRDAEEVHEKILQYVPNDPDSLAFLGRTAKPSALAESVNFDKDEGLSMPPPRRPNQVGRSTGSMPLVNPDDDDFAMPDLPDRHRAEAPPMVAELDLEDDDAYELDSDGVELDDFEEADGIEADGFDPDGFDPDTSNIETQESADEIVKILTETDVYVKYGLHQKAIDHLRKVFDIDDRNIEARERLQDILIKEGREAEGIRELLVLAEHTIMSAPEQALGYIREVLRLDGSNESALDFARRHSLDVGRSAVPTPDDPNGHLALADAEGGELDFEDLAFDELGSGEHIGGASVGAAQPAYATSANESSVTRREDVDYDFAEDARPETMEVDLSQVEVEVADQDLTDGSVEFALEDSGDVLASDELEFDPAAAAAFDAEPGYDPGSYAAGSEFELPDAPAATEQDSYSGYAAPEIDMDEVEELGSGELILDPGSIDAAAVGDEQAPSTSLEDDLDEADFFSSQGLIDDALAILRSLAERHPQNPLVQAKLAELEQEAGGGALPTDTAASDGLGLLDDFEAPDLEEALAAPLPTTLPRAPSVVLERPVDEDDSDTHFDLGLAYKEMGIYGEAIGAFEKVMETPGREVQCRLMIGLCHREQGNLSEAISQFKAGLYAGDISEAEKFSLYYEIGAAYEGLQDPQEALYYYEMVLKKEPDYRDVSSRVEGIKRSAGAAL